MDLYLPMTMGLLDIGSTHLARAKLGLGPAKLSRLTRTSMACPGPNPTPSPAYKNPCRLFTLKLSNECLAHGSTRHQLWNCSFPQACFFLCCRNLKIEVFFHLYDAYDCLFQWTICQSLILITDELLGLLLCIWQQNLQHAILQSICPVTVEEPPGYLS